MVKSSSEQLSHIFISIMFISMMRMMAVLLIAMFMAMFMAMVRSSNTKQLSGLTGNTQRSPTEDTLMLPYISQAYSSSL